MQKAIVSGGAGFIGSYIVDRLLENYDVIVVDDFSLGRQENLINKSRINLLECDCNDVDRVHDYISQTWGNIDYGSVEFWHMAANSDISQGVANADVDLQKTFMTTYNSIELCKRLGIKTFMFASTSAVYGENSENVNEDTGPLFPVSNYGAMKLSSEAILSASTKTIFEHVYIYRFPNVVGGRGTHGALYDFCHKLKKTPNQLQVLGNGSQCKPYIHVRELVDAMFFIKNNANDVINYFNIGMSGRGTTVKYMAEKVVEFSGLKADIKYGDGSIGWVGDVPTFSYNTEKINKLGWSCTMNSDQAVDLAIKELIQDIL